MLIFFKLTNDTNTTQFSTSIHKQSLPQPGCEHSLSMGMLSRDSSSGRRSEQGKGGGSSQSDTGARRVLTLIKLHWHFGLSHYRNAGHGMDTECFLSHKPQTLCVEIESEVCVCYIGTARIAAHGMDDVNKQRLTCAPYRHCCIAGFILLISSHSWSCYLYHNA